MRSTKQKSAVLVPGKMPWPWQGVSLGGWALGDVSSSPPKPPGTPQPSLPRPGKGQDWQTCARTPFPFKKTKAVGQLKEAEASSSSKSYKTAHPVQGLP